MIRYLPLLCALFVPAAAWAQVKAPRTSAGCVLANDEHPAKITATGVLRHATFKDPVGRPERFNVLRLPKATCVEDGGEGQIDGRERVTDIQIFGSDADEARLARYAGKRVTIGGESMPRNTGHHHTPLLIVDPLTINGR